VARRGGSAGARSGTERLLALPPDRFVPERNALAQRLAADGDARAAAEVRKLRRPVGLAWLLNRVAQERPREVEALLAAGDRLRTGQRQAIAGGGARALRDAERDLREAARSLRDAAAASASKVGRAPAGAALGRVELLLRFVAAAPGSVRDALRHGALEREPEIAAGDLSGLSLLPGGAPAGRAARPARAADGRERKRRARAEQEAQERARREAERRARGERATAEREARARGRARAAAERAVARAEAEADAARRRLATTEAKVAKARAALEALPRVGPTGGAGPWR
jgi:hypothetical protein